MKTIYTLSQNFGTMYKKLLLILFFRILINVWSVLCYTPLLLGGGGTLWWSKIVIGFTGLKTACILIEQPNGLALWIAIEDKYYSTNFLKQLFDLWNLQNIKLLFEIRRLSYGARLYKVRFDKWDLTKKNRNYGLASDLNHFCMPAAISGTKSLIAWKY